MGNMDDLMEMTELEGKISEGNVNLSEYFLDLGAYDIVSDIQDMV